MQLIRLLFILSIGFISSTNVYAEENNGVTFIESNHADCASDDSKMISIKSTSGNQPIEVWLDRWFMGVQTADHTKHILTADDNTHDLGCSVTRRGEKQQWIIYSVKPLNSGS